MRAAYHTHRVQRHGKSGRQTLVQRRMDDILLSLGMGDDTDGVHSSPQGVGTGASSFWQCTAMVTTPVLIGPAVL